MNFKDRLREEIEFKGFQIKEIASKIGISNSTLLSYIDARGVLPNVETAVKIADALNVSVEYLVTGKDFVHNSKYKNIQEITDLLLCLDSETLEILKKMIEPLAKQGRN